MGPQYSGSHLWGSGCPSGDPGSPLGPEAPSQHSPLASVKPGICLLFHPPQGCPPAHKHPGRTCRAGASGERMHVGNGGPTLLSGGSSQIHRIQPCRPGTAQLQEHQSHRREVKGTAPQSRATW